MIWHDEVYASEKPKLVEIYETKVFVNSNFEQVEKEVEEGVIAEWRFSQEEYSKDEYIEMIASRNNMLEQSLIDTQLAIAEVYEMLEV